MIRVLAQLAPLDEYFLLLGDGCLQLPHPANDVPMTDRQLISPPDLDEVLQLLLVFLQGQLEGELLDLELPFEEVYWVLPIVSRNTMLRQCERVYLHDFISYIDVHLIYDLVVLFFQFVNLFVYLPRRGPCSVLLYLLGIPIKIARVLEHNRCW